MRDLVQSKEVEIAIGRREFWIVFCRRKRGRRRGRNLKIILCWRRGGIASGGFGGRHP